MATSKADSGIVNIHGKQYQTVAYRVGKFREINPAWGLITEILERDDMVVVVQARIEDETGRVISTGHAEEYRQSSTINKTSALENAETSAIGRALAGLGFGGTEFATADEVANAITNKPKAPVINPVTESLAGVVVDGGKVQEVAKAFIDFHAAFEQGDDDADYGAFELSESLDSDMKLAVWAALKDFSKVRAWIKDVSAARRAAA